MRVQANFRALKLTFGLRLREKAKEMEREKCFIPLSLLDPGIKVFLVMSDHLLKSY